METNAAGASPVDQRVVARPQVYAWECNVRGKDWQRTINHATAGKARYEYLIDLRESWPDATFAEITVRKIGPAHTSEAFQKTATYRGMPELRCGQRVEIRSPEGPALGVIVGHNDSANFDVLFDADTYFKGGIGNVHPSELRVVADERHNAEVSVAGTASAGLPGYASAAKQGG